MKELASIEKDLGSDGKAKASLAVNGDQLQAQVSVTYPIAKIIEPATNAVDSLLEKLKAAIPGDWENPLIDGFKAEYKSELIKLLAE